MRSRQANCRGIVCSVGVRPHWRRDRPCYRRIDLFCATSTPRTMALGSARGWHLCRRARQERARHHHGPPLGPVSPQHRRPHYPPRVLVMLRVGRAAQPRSTLAWKPPLSSRKERERDISRAARRLVKPPPAPAHGLGAPVRQLRFFGGEVPARPPPQDGV